jgi:high-affinity Fe2+/Pb2+ permease
MERPEIDPPASAAAAAPSAATKKKILTIIGIALMAAGFAGMIIFGSRAIETIQSGGFANPGQGSSFEVIEYIFMFMLIAGLVLVIYSQLSIQMAKARKWQSKSRQKGNTAAA